MSDLRCLITGATGATGGATAVQLLEKGRQVHAFVHRADERSETFASSGRSADAFIRGVKEQAAGLDANDLIYSLESSGDFDAEPGLSRVKIKVLAVNFADDEFYRGSLQTLERDIRAVRSGRSVVRAASDGSAGHMSMAYPALWADQAGDFVAWLSAN